MGGSRAWFCDECRKIRKAESDKRMRHKRKTDDYIPLGSIIQCELCNKDIIKNSGHHRFCRECAPIHLKSVDNRQSLEWKRKNPEKIKEGKRKLSKRKHAEEGKASGIKYITWNKGKQKWGVRPYIDGKQIMLGHFAELSEAEEKLNNFMKQKTTN